MKQKDLSKFDLPDNPGVYTFLSKTGEILYIGKATSLKNRVKSYFAKDLITTRGPHIFNIVDSAASVGWETTDTVLEALILESNLIKKHQPKGNTKEKDDKSFNYVCVTRDEWPRVIIERGKNIDFKKNIAGGKKVKSIYGPFTSGGLLRDALKIIRRIFPFLDAKTLQKDRYEFYKQIHLAPDIGETDAHMQYLHNIKHIEQFLKGEKKKILKSLESEMRQSAKKMDFERASEIKRQIFALTHINDVALVKEDITQVNPFSQVLGSSLPAARPGHSKKDLIDSYKERIYSALRIEAYDISHISGKNMVGAYITRVGSEFEKSGYRKFIIKGFDSANDPGALSELVQRRLRHPEWVLPDLIIADGNHIQKKIIEAALLEKDLNIPVIAVVKDNKHKARAMIGDETLIRRFKKDILAANAEVHRFVLAFHKNRRGKSFLPFKK